MAPRRFISYHGMRADPPENVLNVLYFFFFFIHYHRSERTPIRDNAVIVLKK